MKDIRQPTQSVQYITPDSIKSIRSFSARVRAPPVCRSRRMVRLCCLKIVSITASKETRKDTHQALYEIKAVEHKLVDQERAMAAAPYLSVNSFPSAFWASKPPKTYSKPLFGKTVGPHELWLSLIISVATFVQVRSLLALLYLENLLVVKMINKMKTAWIGRFRRHSMHALQDTMMSPRMICKNDASDGSLIDDRKNC